MFISFFSWFDYSVNLVALKFLINKPNPHAHKLHIFANKIWYATIQKLKKTKFDVTNMSYIIYQKLNTNSC